MNRDILARVGGGEACEGVGERAGLGMTKSGRPVSNENWKKKKKDKVD